MRAEVFQFAPHLGLFQPGPGLFHHTVGLDPVDQISFIADQGFTAVQDNFLRLREHRVQERIGTALAQRGMTMGSFVATLAFDRPTFGSDDPSAVEFLRQSMRDALGRGQARQLQMAHHHSRLAADSGRHRSTARNRNFKSAAMRRRGGKGRRRTTAGGP